MCAYLCVCVCQPLHHVLFYMLYIASILKHKHVVHHSSLTKQLPAVGRSCQARPSNKQQLQTSSRLVHVQNLQNSLNMHAKKMWTSHEKSRSPAKKDCHANLKKSPASRTAMQNEKPCKQNCQKHANQKTCHAKTCHGKTCHAKTCHAKKAMHKKKPCKHMFESSSELSCPNMHETQQTCLPMLFFRLFNTIHTELLEISSKPTAMLPASTHTKLIGLLTKCCNIKTLLG